MKLSNQREILVRLGRADINVPNCDGFTFDTIIRELNFESAAYTLLSGHPEIPVSTLLYLRPPVKHESGVDYDVGRSVQGRRLMVFDFSHGRSNVWWQLLPEGKVSSQFLHFLHRVANISFHHLG